MIRMALPDAARAKLSDLQLPRILERIENAWRLHEPRRSTPIRSRQAAVA